MNTSISIATRDEIDEIAEVMGEVGLSKNPKRLRDFFFGVPMAESDLPVRGGVVVKENDRIVGFCGLMPCRVFCRDRAYDGYQMGVLGLKPGHGLDMFALIDYVKGIARNSFLIANTANGKSAKLWTVYGGCHPGPDSAAFIHYAVLPLSLLSLPRVKPDANSLSDFALPQFKTFWTNYAKDSPGPFVSREPSRLSRLFDARLKARQLVLLTACAQGEVRGYAVLQPRPLSRTPYFRFVIMDIAAIGHAANVLEELFRQIFRYAHRHGGVMVEYIGATRGLSDLVHRYLPRKRAALSNTAFWYTDIPDLAKAFADNEGWIFGPYDGDRCV